MKKLLFVMLTMTMIIGFAFAQPAPPVVTPGAFSVTGVGEYLSIPGATESADKTNQVWWSVYGRYDFGKMKESRLSPFFTIAYGAGFQNSTKLSDWGHAGFGMAWKTVDGLDMSLGIRGSYIGDLNARVAGSVYKYFQAALSGMDLVVQVEGEFVPPLEKKNGKDFSGFGVYPRLSLVSGDWRFGANPSYYKDSTLFSDGKEHEAVKIGGFVGYKNFEFSVARYTNGWQRYSNGELKPFWGAGLSYKLNF